jgi:hypothetical protein
VVGGTVLGAAEGATEDAGCDVVGTALVDTMVVDGIAEPDPAGATDALRGGADETEVQPASANSSASRAAFTTAATS